MSDECDVCHNKRTLWNRVKLYHVTIGMSFDYGGVAALCNVCEELYYDSDNIGNPYWRVIPILGWKD